VIITWTWLFANR